MAYDSASDTEAAGQAWKRAILAADQRRTALNRGYGLNADGSMDNSDVGHLGSLYQTNLDSVEATHSAEISDRRRGFAGQGGLASKATDAADRAAQQRQASGFRDATTQLGFNTQDHDAANQQYEDDKTNIRNKSTWDLAHTLVDQPISGSVPNSITPFAAKSPAYLTAMRVTGTKTAAAALKKNPRIMQTIRNY